MENANDIKRNNYYNSNINIDINNSYNSKVIKNKINEIEEK